MTTWFHKENADEWKFAGMWLADFDTEKDQRIVSAVNAAVSGADPKDVLVLFENVNAEWQAGHETGWCVMRANLDERNKSFAKGYKRPDSTKFAEAASVQVYICSQDKLVTVTL